MATTADAFSTFVQSKRAKLRLIASRTCGEYTEGDVMGEAWLTVLSDEVAGIAGQSDVFDLSGCSTAKLNHFPDIKKMVCRLKA